MVASGWGCHLSTGPPDSPHLPQPLTEASLARPSAECHISTTQEASQALPSVRHHIRASHLAADLGSSTKVVLPFCSTQGPLKRTDPCGPQPPHCANLSLPVIWTQPTFGHDDLVVTSHQPSQPPFSAPSEVTENHPSVTRCKRCDRCQLLHRAEKPVGQIQFPNQVGSHRLHIHWRRQPALVSTTGGQQSVSNPNFKQACRW